MLLLKGDSLTEVRLRNFFLVFCKELYWLPSFKHQTQNVNDNNKIVKRKKMIIVKFRTGIKIGIFLEILNRISGHEGLSKRKKM